MDILKLMSEMERHRLVAVVRSKSAEEALATAEAAAAGGVKFIEITFTVPGAVEVIAELAKRGGGYVGAGTVLSATQAKAAIKSGAQFVVAPSLELELIPLCHESGAACFPGAATPTEILTAARAKADLVKIFPADCLGGPHFIKQMAGPFPEIRFIVSGGVSLENVKEYVQAGAIGICLGSVFLGSHLARQGRDGLARAVKEFVQSVSEAQKKLS
ncbi:MAG TPA: bifunctional 4-hydroxy-2-oxoglutarate aldolase/2-dehydro-3-deoxy-phosphogluconate aldolase [Terriglobales bacterium]|nr:bifunctional 4-hydroxy-2-oxoglutarate aldolase/2-dehydro-3-deoxy-phosphogluconate aldolase [Terriglobales bacterium]